MNVSQKPKRALILIDVQNEYVTGNFPIEYPSLDVSLPNIARAIKTAQERGIPVVAVQHMAPESSPVFAEGSEGWQLHSVVASAKPDLVVQKHLASALFGTNLGDWLKELGVDTLVVAGYMSQNCNESTIRHAAHEGFAVEYLHDAAGAVSYQNSMGLLKAKDMHEASCIVLQAGFAAVMTTQEWIDLVGLDTPAERDNLYVSRLRAHGLM